MTFSSSCKKKVIGIFFCTVAYAIYMLKVERKRFYRVKTGQSLKEIANAFCVSEFLLAKCNGLKAQPFAGQILLIPSERGNAYLVKQGDDKTLLCGNEDNYKKKNGTDILYLGMRVIL